MIAKEKLNRKITKLAATVEVIKDSEAKDQYQNNDTPYALIQDGKIIDHNFYVVFSGELEPKEMASLEDRVIDNEQEKSMTKLDKLKSSIGIGD